MRTIARPLIVVITFVATLVINGMASSGALGGTPTADISNAYPIYFVPANLTFAVWGVIYLGLGAYTVFQALPRQWNTPYVQRISGLFVLSNLLNTLWLLLFQAEQFILSVPVMLVLLGTLITIYLRLDPGKAVSQAVHWFMQVPFSIYLAWITIATIANVSQTLYAQGVTELGLGGEAWAAIMIGVGTLIISTVVYRAHGNAAYALTTIWAIAGILIAQGPRSTLVGGAAAVAIAVILAVLAYSVWQQRRPQPTSPAFKSQPSAG